MLALPRRRRWCVTEKLGALVLLAPAGILMSTSCAAHDSCHSTPLAPCHSLLGHLVEVRRPLPVAARGSCFLA